MEYRPLGRSGLMVSKLGLGGNNFGRRLDQEETTQVVSAALDAGVNLIDTAAAYGDSEEQLGKAIAGRRDDVVLATKFPSPHEPTKHGHGSRRHVVAACEGSLRRLRTDYIDLYQMHFHDPGTPMEETLSALDDLVRAGKVRYIGCSNFAGWQIGEAAWLARTHNWAPMISAQNEYSLINRDVEQEVSPACVHYGLGILPYFPLASGLLTGKYKRGQESPAGARLAGQAMAAAAERFLTDQNFEKVERLNKIAADSGVTLLHLAFGGLAAQPAVSSVIAGATTTMQVRDNVEAASWTPSPDVLAAVDEATVARP